MTNDFISKAGYKLCLHGDLHGYSLVYRDEDKTVINIPLELRELLALRSACSAAIDDLQNDLEEEPFNPSW